MKELTDLFPSLYSKDFFFECGDGWFSLLLELSGQLEEEIKSQPSPNELEFKVSQVKEKYGTLRFYVSFQTDKVEELIHEAEKKSKHICESCGAPGVLMLYNNWRNVRCADCQQAFCL